MNYNFRIDQFEGPLDLLLHLIKESKIDICDIKIVDICEEYLNYIKHMEELNLDIASEYLVMASELMEIKSKSLLPRCMDESIEEEDPRENLINRLIEYQKYKDMTASFKELEEARKEFYTKLPENVKNYSDNETLVNEDLSVDDLVNAFKKFLERVEMEKPIHTKVTRKELSVEDRMVSIKNKFKNNSRIAFFDLFEVKTKEYLVVTFLAILELAKKREIIIKQDNNFDNIICEKVDDE